MKKLNEAEFQPRMVDVSFFLQLASHFWIEEEDKRGMYRKIELWLIAYGRQKFKIHGIDMNNQMQMFSSNINWMPWHFALLY